MGLSMRNEKHDLQLAAEITSRRRTRSPGPIREVRAGSAACASDLATQDLGGDWILTRAEGAAYLKVSVRTFDRLALSKSYVGRQVRIRKSHLDAFLASS